VVGNGEDRDESAGPQPSRGDKRLYFVLMTVCIGLFVISWAVLDRYSVTAAVVVSVVALAIPPFAAIIANARSATDRRRPLRVTVAMGRRYPTRLTVVSGQLVQGECARSDLEARPDSIPLRVNGH
jgi:hypothetical protein